MASIYFDLLKEWCDSLLELQINEIKSPALNGGILCPACARIHGRSADAAYPLMHMARATGESRYIDAAVRLQAWAESMSCPDGSWVNEPDSSWKAITVFGTLSLAEALRHHGALLEKEVYDRWLKRMKKGAEYVYNTFTINTGNINYPVSAAAALTVAGTLLDRPDFMKKGRDFAHTALRYFTENGLLFGEGDPRDGYSPRGRRPVDLGYNVEESLPAMVLYGLLSGDEEVLQAATASMRAHLEFMLPDGAWDNSWGSRDFKWTYWGSRTSDGCQAAYALLAGREPAFAEAALRNTLLMKACTHDGILYGGPHYHIKGELPCIHHTLTHAKALASLLDYGAAGHGAQSVPLPRETAKDVGEFPEIGTWLAATGPWRATVTSYDWEYMKEGHPGGGSISMLWHERLGPLLAGSLTEYTMKEPANMQRIRDSVSMPLTPRLEIVRDGVCYRSVNDYNADVTYECSGDKITFLAEGRLMDGEHKHPAAGEVKYRIKYVFSPDSVEITVSCGAGDGRYYLPVVSPRTEEVVRQGPGDVEIAKKGGRLLVSSPSPIETVECENGRIFNHVPGFEAVPLYISPGKEGGIRIEVG